jgi:hypothetical protein
MFRGVVELRLDEKCARVGCAFYGNFFCACVLCDVVYVCMYIYICHMSYAGSLCVVISSCHHTGALRILWASSC